MFDRELVQHALTPFTNAIGAGFDKIVTDVFALLNSANVSGTYKIDRKDWKCGASMKMTRKSGESVQLPKELPQSILFAVGMQIQDLAGKYEMPEVQADIPRSCKSWVAKQQAKAAQATSEEVVTPVV